MAMLNNQRVYIYIDIYIIYISWFSKHIITISSSVFIHQTRISLGRPSWQWCFRSKKVDRPTLRLDEDQESQVTQFS